MIPFFDTFGPRIAKFALRPIEQDRPVNILDGSVRSGKAQPLDARILTPDGWKWMKDIRVGDKVIAGDGTTTRVEGVFPQGRKEIFYIHFSDGSKTECCAEHLWATWTTYERMAAKRHPNCSRAKPKIRTTKELAAKLGSNQYSVPLVGPVQFRGRKIPIDPYVLGVLLGDGCFRRKRKSVTFSSADSEIVDYLNDNIPGCEVHHRKHYDYAIVLKKSKKTHCRRGHKLSKKGPCQTCGKLWKMSRHRGRYSPEYVRLEKRTHPVLKYLLSSGLYGRYSYEKSIPEEYLFNSVHVRLEMLRGLMDTDGYVSKGSTTKFYTSSRQLRKDVCFLVRSLGGTAKKSVKLKPQYTYKGIKKHGRPSYRLLIRMPVDINPFKLKRKALKVVPKTKWVAVRYITKIESAGFKKAQCIKVSHPSHLYVTDDFIVTHNTWAMIPKILYATQSPVTGWRVLTGVSKQTIYNNVLNDLFTILGPANYHYNSSSGHLSLCGSKWIVIGAKDEGSEKYIRGSTIGICVADEITQMPKTFYDMIQTRLSPAGARFYGTTNPDNPYHWLNTEVLSNPKIKKLKLLYHLHCTMDDNPNIPKVFKDRLKAQFTGVFYDRFILGKWVMAEGSIYRDSWSDTENTYTDEDRPIALYNQGGHQDRWVSVDVGVDHPQVYLMHYDDGDTIWVDNEYFWDSRVEMRQKTDGEYADDMIDFMGRNNACQIIIPPEAASFEAELQMRGLWVTQAENEVLEGIQTLSSLMSCRKIRYHKTRCANTIASLVNHSWDPLAAKRGVEQPLKKKDDGADCARYGVHGKVPKWRCMPTEKAA